MLKLNSNKAHLCGKLFQSNVFFRFSETKIVCKFLDPSRIVFEFMFVRLIWYSYYWLLHTRFTRYGNGYGVRYVYGWLLKKWVRKRYEYGLNLKTWYGNGTDTNLNRKEEYGNGTDTDWLQFRSTGTESVPVPVLRSMGFTKNYWVWLRLLVWHIKEVRVDVGCGQVIVQLFNLKIK